MRERDYILKTFEPFQDKVSVFDENSGLHILLTFKDGRNADDILGYGALSLNVLKQAIPKLIDILFH